MPYVKNKLSFFIFKMTSIDYQLTELWYFTCPHPKTDRFGALDFIFELFIDTIKLDIDDSYLKVLG